MFDGLIPNKQRREELQIARDQVTVQRDMAAIGSVADDTAFIHDREAKSDLTRWQQDLNDELDQLQHDLRREYKVNGKWVQIPGTHPMLNNNGVFTIINLVKVYLNRNVMMSNLSSEIINRTMIGLIRDLVKVLGANFDVFEISFHDMSITKRIVSDRVEATLYRCFNNGERAYLNTVNKRAEVFTENAGAGQNKGLIKNLLGG